MSDTSRYSLDRVAKSLEEAYGDLIDMSDWSSRPNDQKRDAFMSRALGALCIEKLAQVDPEVAAESVVDEGDDNGIDNVYYDPVAGVLYAVQAKWKKDQNAGLKIADSQRFETGLRDLLAPRFGKFGEKLRAKEALLKRVLWEPATQIVAVTIHTGSQRLTGQAAAPLDEWLGDMNSEVKQAELKHLVFEDVWGMLTAGLKPAEIELVVYLRDYGRLRAPVTAYYGRVKVSEVSMWWRRHGRTLCARNLRHFNSSTKVNSAIGATLRGNASRFWYFNNGITMVCNDVEAALGGDEKLIALKCKDVSIVNGAQTYGMIGLEAVPAQESPGGGELDASDEDGWVQVRIIVTGEPDGAFERSITRATNFQNAVEARDLAALDHNQHRLAVEFAIEERKYTFKSGDEDATGNDGCSLHEATQALGCALGSIETAVQVKREIGVIWQDTTSAPYTSLFSGDTTGPMVWNAVQIMRAVDARLHELRSSEYPRADLVAVHLNRLILHMVFQDERLAAFREHSASIEELCELARGNCDAVFSVIANYIERHHPSDYLASFAKNLSKCTMVSKLEWVRPSRESEDRQDSRSVGPERMGDSLFGEAHD